MRVSLHLATPRTAGALVRHRAFLAGLRRARRGDAQASRVTQVLRRLFVATTSIGVVLSFLRSIVGVVNGPAAAAAARGGRALLAPFFTTRHHWHVLQRAASLRVPIADMPQPRLEVVRHPAAPRTILAAASSPAERRAAFPRVHLTLVRTQPAPVAPAMQPDPARLPSAPRGARAPGLARGAAFAPLPPDELSRVTEHVLRTLDRRVLSYRERTGQV